MIPIQLLPWKLCIRKQDIYEGVYSQLFHGFFMPLIVCLVLVFCLLVPNKDVHDLHILQENEFIFVP